MPDFKQITAARLRAKRMREYAAEFRRELNLERIAEIHPTTEGNKNGRDVRLFVVKLRTRTTKREAA